MSQAPQQHVHPKTGRPIKIMRSDASVWRNKKTIVWLKNQSNQSNNKKINWDRWETVCEGVDDILKWEQLKYRIDIVLLTDTDDKSLEWFKSISNNLTQYKIIFVTKEFVIKFGIEAFRELKPTNVICLEEIHQLYSFIKTQWDNTVEDAIMMIAILMRMACVSSDKSIETHRIEEMKETGYAISLLPSYKEPQELWFITQYYKPKNSNREREIRKCLDLNSKSQIIDKIVLLNEQDYFSRFPKTSNLNKIEQHVIGHRLTYSDVIRWIHDNSVPENTICVFANADIVLDSESWLSIWSTELSNVFMSLLRWDIKEDENDDKNTNDNEIQSKAELFGPRNDSQDTWVVLSDSVKAISWDYSSLNFPFGQGGCDNAINVEMLRKKFLVVNPALSLKTYHYQLSGIRTYDPQDIVDKPAYMHVDPTGIHDMKPILDLSQFNMPNGKKELVAFNRELNAVQPKVLNIFTKMLERKNKYTWTATDTNKEQAQTIQYYKYKNVFQTYQGLVYSYDTLYVGKSTKSKEAWTKSRMSCMSPAYGVKKCYIAPYDEEETKTKEGYLLNYISKILMTWEVDGFSSTPGEFFGPQNKDDVNILDMFNWRNQHMSIIPYSENTQVFCQEAIQYPWADNIDIRVENINALRTALKDNWISTVSLNTSSNKPIWIVMVDEKYITSDMVHNLEEKYQTFDFKVLYHERTTTDRCVDKIKGASGYICYGGSDSITKWGYTWVLPTKANVVEIQNEMDPCGDLAHLCGASDLKYNMIVIPKTPNDNIMRDMITKQLNKTLDSLLVVVDTTATKLPVIRIPTLKQNEGFFGHSGDTFRELARLWAEKGYVRIIEDPHVVNVWVGNVGDVLLYDRPTLDWLNKSPFTEQTWKLALFGNPAPTGKNSTSWIFWGRSPKVLEYMVEKGIGNRSWDSRHKTLVFYGKIENSVQEKNRTQQDWSLCCDEYSMVKGNEPYKYSQEEYLEKLSESKFGLILPGFGLKCNRDIECLALGTVLIVAPDVDMDNYYNHLIQGVHYIRVSSPQHALDVVNTMTNEKWHRISEAGKRWWKENCSVDGSWKTTKHIIDIKNLAQPFDLINYF